MGRKCFAIVGLASTVVVSATGCQPGPGTEAFARIVQIGSTKADLFGLPAEFRALHPALERCLGRPVCFPPQPDGPALATQLEQGIMDYAILSATEYAAIEEPGKLTLLASGVNTLGKTARQAYLVVRAQSHVKTVADCRAKRFAFGTHGDLLTDIAARRALEDAGVSVKDLLPEILTPPPFAVEGRLYLKNDVAKTIINDITVNAGVIDEVTYESMPETGGNFITGPSKDQFKIVGRTVPVPEMVVVAGPGAEADLTAKLRDYLLNEVKNDERVRRQLGLRGFTAPDAEAYDTVRQLLAQPRSP